MTDLAREYGEGLFELARDEQLLDVIGEQMNVLRDAFKANPEFIRLLESHALTKAERLQLIDQLTKEMKNAARLLEFEHAAMLRDRIKQLQEGK